jgi:FKBP-type peptidyl-prolyl cis-trans isomerase FkpA/FKBP-type peptidyl-prolyl cis-trans isomerase FklB
MRNTLVSIAALIAVFASAAPAFAAAPKTDDEKTLYAIGLALSRNLAPFNLTKTELDMVQSGLADGATNKKPLVDMQEYGPKIMDLQQKRLAAVAGKEKQAAKAFQDKAAAEKGSVKTSSGLIYTSIKEGSGESPKATDTVKVHYHGTLTNGTVFDSSVKRGEPISFPLSGVIPCWTEGVQKMKVGGKARLVCPSDIAYGDQGRPPVIAPGATLVFEVELLEIAKQ